MYTFSDQLIAKDIILEAIYDGPIDNRGFSYQPVILEKLPDLADGDAILAAVEISAGDTVVDAAGSVVILEAGMQVRPSGCQSADCAIEYDGSSPLTMDQLVVTFHMLPGLLWSDGQTLTSSDSVYAFSLEADPGTPSSNTTIGRSASYRAVDETTTEWVGLPGFLDSTYFLNYWSPLPEHLWGGFSAAELLTADISHRKPLGWGPYVIDEWLEGESMLLSKNEHYYRADEGLPKFDQVLFRFNITTNPDTAIDSLISGDCDLLSISGSGGQNSSTLIELNNAGQVSASFVPGTVWEHIDFGIQPSSYDDGWQPGDRPDFFGDVRTRQAIALCLDRESMAAAFSSGIPQLLDTYLPAQHPLANPEVKRYPFDVANGSSLLEEVGWELGDDGIRIYAGEHERIPAGTRFSIQYELLGGVVQEPYLVLEDNLRQCGIDLTINYWDASIFEDGPVGILFGRNFDLGGFKWLTGVEPPCDLWLSEYIPGEDTSVFPRGWTGWNNTGYANPAYDSVCQAAKNSLPGQPGYVENHLLAQAIFAEELPVIPLWVIAKIGVSRPDFCNYIVDPTQNTDTWNIEAFDYGSGCGGE
jgi:peptide/nickel transport system substrate-binding protein